MGRTGLVIGLVIAGMGLGPAGAQERPLTPTLTCAVVQGLVTQRHDVSLATSPNAYEMVHADSMECASDETSVPAFEPTSDNPNCLAGWRCRQRSSGDSNK